jgi:hypothetical protein
MFVDPSVTAICALAPNLPSGLLLGRNEQLPDFLVSAAATGVVAVGLNGRLKFKFIDVTKPSQAFRGCLISDVAIEVDTTSYFTIYSRYPRPGEIVIDDAKVAIAAVSADPFANAVHVEWSGAINVSSAAMQGGFSRWRVIQRQKLCDVTLLEIDVDRPDES